MTVFTEEQMHRPLFEEPTVEIERPDEWSEPLGFLVGGAANQRYQHLGQQYFHAANHLVECIKHQDVADCEVANPVLYLYSHSIELFLKSIMKGAAKTHSLDTLAEEYRTFIKEQFDAVCPEWIISRMKELGAIDPNSTAFRYNMNYNKSTKSDSARRWRVSRKPSSSAIGHDRVKYCPRRHHRNGCLWRREGGPMTLRPSDSLHKEKVLQEHLVGQLLTHEGYERSVALKSYDRALAMDTDLVLRFVKATQADQWDKLAAQYVLRQRTPSSRS